MKNIAGSFLLKYHIVKNTFFRKDASDTIIEKDMTKKWIKYVNVYQE